MGQILRVLHITVESCSCTEYCSTEYWILDLVEPDLHNLEEAQKLKVELAGSRSCGFNCAYECDWYIYSTGIFFSIGSTNPTKCDKEIHPEHSASQAHTLVVEKANRNHHEIHCPCYSVGIGCCLCTSCQGTFP